MRSCLGWVLRSSKACATGISGRILPGVLMLCCALMHAPETADWMLAAFAAEVLLRYALHCCLTSLFVAVIPSTSGTAGFMRVIACSPVTTSCPHVVMTGRRWVVGPRRNWTEESFECARMAEN